MVRQPASSSTTAEREVSDEARVVQRCGSPRPVRGFLDADPVGSLAVDTLRSHRSDAPAPKILLPPVVTMTATLAASSTGRCPIDALADLTGCGSARAGSSHGFERVQRMSAPQSAGPELIPTGTAKWHIRTVLRRLRNSIARVEDLQ